MEIGSASILLVPVTSLGLDLLGLTVEWMTLRLWIIIEGSVITMKVYELTILGETSSMEPSELSGTS